MLILTVIVSFICGILISLLSLVVGALIILARLTSKTAYITGLEISEVASFYNRIYENDLTKTDVQLLRQIIKHT